jgi:nicotinamidase-related amidase
MSETTIDPAVTGLVLVDPYNDVLSEGGKVWPRVHETVEATGTVEHLRELLAAFRTAGLPVFIAPHRRWRPGDTSRWQHAARTHRGLAGLQLFAEGTFGGDWHPDLRPRAGEIVASEHWAMNGFAGTDLDLQLRQHGVQNIVLAGMTAPGCVEGSGRYALELGYSVTLVRDATAAFSKELLHAVTDLTGPFWAEAILPAADVIAAITSTSTTR